MRTRVGALFGFVLVAAVVAAIGAAPASAAETRADYVAQTDRICKDANREFKRVFRKLGRVAFKPIAPDAEKPSQKELNRANRLLARFVGTTNRVFGRMVRRISFVPIPVGDEQTVLDWLAGMRAYRRLNDRSNLAFKRGQFNKSGRLFGRALESLQNGALAVRDWGYRHCPAGNMFE